MKYITYIEIVVGIGLGLGPAIGSFVYDSLQYSGSMYMFGIINSIGMFICSSCIPSELN